MSKFKTTLKGGASSYALKICNSLIKFVKEDFSDALPRDRGARPHLLVLAYDNYCMTSWLAMSVLLSVPGWLVGLADVKAHVSRGSKPKCSCYGLTSIQPRWFFRFRKIAWCFEAAGERLGILFWRWNVVVIVGRKV